MEVILLERIEKLGQMGDVVKVKDGYARNFLLPQKKALRSNKANLEYFQTQRVQLEAQNLERKNDAEAVSEQLDGQMITVIRQAGESGQLYGSVTTRDISNAVTEGGTTIQRSQVSLDRPIKMIGLHNIRVVLHPEVSVMIELNVARSPEEAERQAQGEILIGGPDEFDDEEAIEAEDVFERADLAEAAEANLTDAEASEETTEETEPQASEAEDEPSQD